MLQQCYMELLKQKEGGNRMNHYEAINDVLVNLFNEILDLEERALITGEYKNISVNDMHIINAVGIREQKNMSTVARELNVTVEECLRKNQDTERNLSYFMSTALVILFSLFSFFTGI